MTPGRWCLANSSKSFSLSRMMAGRSEVKLFCLRMWSELFFQSVALVVRRLENRNSIQVNWRHRLSHDEQPHATCLIDLFQFFLGCLPASHDEFFIAYQSMPSTDRADLLWRHAFRSIENCVLLLECCRDHFEFKA